MPHKWSPDIRCVNSTWNDCEVCRLKRQYDLSLCTTSYYGPDGQSHKEPPCEDAVNRGQLRPDSNEQRPIDTGAGLRNREVREAMQDQRNHGDVNAEVAVRSENGAGSQPDPGLRASPRICVVSPEFVAELRQARDTLHRLIGALGDGGRTAGDKRGVNTLPDGGLCGTGTIDLAGLKGVVTTVGTSVPGSDSLSIPLWRYGDWD